MTTPSASEFEQLAAQGFQSDPGRREIAADLETPVSAFLKVARGDYSFLLGERARRREMGTLYFSRHGARDGDTRARAKEWT